MNDHDLDSVFNDEWPEGHKSGVVAVVGKPNVGKSTLINQILGQKIAIVTPKPQTTRRKQLGIYTTDEGQILFADTPGVHMPQHKLGEYMVKMAESSLKDADAILVLFDTTNGPDAEDRRIVESVNRYRRNVPVFLVFNKIDLGDPKRRETNISAYKGLIDHERIFPVSALRGEGVQELLDALLDRLPEGPRYYPAEQVSEVNLRFIAAEIVREKVMLHTEQEIPHSVAVEVDSFQEREDDLTYVSAIIYVERDSQKGIVIGKGGKLLKQIGSEARNDLEAMVGTKVFLDLRVKVLANWRSDDKLMQRLGYRTEKERD